MLGLKVLWSSARAQLLQEKSRKVLRRGVLVEYKTDTKIDLSKLRLKKGEGVILSKGGASQSLSSTEHVV